ncbi:hypothetical protein MSAN_00539700 [Mycena sanguinolenta]|uniref:DUF6534 domain-containing protein n=1 Tax=Mycena sanguinolenta TaxID=230812 RepID=A0A8H6Z977_9AGAR|nr:hypothetical protein MSAN_00539700 [Mycena sanguinolenta]
MSKISSVSIFPHLHIFSHCYGHSAGRETFTWADIHWYLSQCLVIWCMHITIRNILSVRTSSHRLLHHSCSALVIWEFFLSIFSTVTSIYFVWLYLVENYFNPEFLGSGPWPLTAVPLLSGLSACPVQIFMAYRVLRFSRSRFVFGLLVFLTISNGATAFATSVLAFGVPFDEGSRLTPVVDSWLGITVANDVAITLFLIYYLHKSRTGFSITNTVISRLIRSAIESAAFASFFLGHGLDYVYYVSQNWLAPPVFTTNGPYLYEHFIINSQRTRWSA